MIVVQRVLTEPSKRYFAASELTWLYKFIFIQMRKDCLEAKSSCFTTANQSKNVLNIFLFEKVIILIFALFASLVDLSYLK